MRIIPNSFGVDLREENPCHEPAGSPVGGQFCSTGHAVGSTGAHLVRPGQTFDVVAAAAAGYQGGARVSRRYLFNPTTGEMVIGVALGGKDRDQSHAEAFAVAGQPASRYDAFTVHGWLRKSLDAPEAPPIVSVTRVAGAEGGSAEHEVATSDALAAFAARLAGWNAHGDVGWVMDSPRLVSHGRVQVSTLRKAYPDVYGRKRRRVREANDCHEPAGRPTGGQFCSKGGGLPGLGDVIAASDLADLLYSWEVNKHWDTLPEDVTEAHIAAVKAATSVPEVLAAIGISIERTVEPNDFGKSMKNVEALHVIDLGGTLHVVDGTSVEDGVEYLNGLNNNQEIYYIDEENFSEEFWQSPEAVYHATKADRVEDILRGGLKATNESRGLTNRSTGAAVFTSVDQMAIESYGDFVFEIDTGAMKRDGVTPQVRLEGPVEDQDLHNRFAAALGIPSDGYRDNFDGIEESTRVFFGDIPAKYVRLVTAYGEDVPGSDGTADYQAYLRSLLQERGV